MWARPLCSAALRPSLVSRELKKHLHRLYQRVHPDRFAQHPIARDVNQRSFQALQAAISLHFPDRPAPSRAESPPQKVQAETLDFFAHADEAGDELRRAQVQLRPGANALAKALVQLFKQLGLDPPPQTALRVPLSSKERQKFTSIGALARHARMYAMKHAAARQEKAAQAAVDSAGQGGDAQVLFLALQRAHGVRILVHPALPRDVRLAAILARLRDALRDTSHGEYGANVLRGAVLELDPGAVTSVLRDGGSDVMLGACSRRAEWDAVLTDEELIERCEKRRMYERETRRLEQAAASNLQVGLVMHHLSQKETVQIEYRALLMNLEANNNAVREDDDRVKVALMIVPGDNVACDERSGVLRVGLKLGAAGINAAVQRHAAALGKANTRIKADQERREKERAAIARALRLGGLRREEGVNDAQWMHCVHTMRERATRLKGLLDGANVQVVNGEAGVGEDGEIRIPWDFSVHMQE